MTKLKRNQEVIRIPLKSYKPKEFEKIRQQIKALKEQGFAEQFYTSPRELSYPDIPKAYLTVKDLHSAPLWYFFRMQMGNRYNRDLWWGWHGHDAFGWWEGENPFKGFVASDDFQGDITYLKSLDYKVKKDKEKGYSEPQGERAFFVVADIEEALNALEDIADSFALSYEDGAVKLYAWNEEKPDFRACLMMAYR